MKQAKETFQREIQPITTAATPTSSNTTSSTTITITERIYKKNYGIVDEKNSNKHKQKRNKETNDGAVAKETRPITTTPRTTKPKPNTVTFALLHFLIFYPFIMNSALCKLRPRLLTPFYMRRCQSTSSGHAKTEYSSSKETHFGYEHVSEKQKAHKVHGVFENVASNYDLMNDLMSGGIHRLWKDCFISRLQPRPNTRLLDVAGGTGDITFRYIQHLLHKRNRDTRVKTPSINMSAPSDKEENTAEEPPLYEIAVCDISQGMLDVGKKRAESLGYSGITWVCGDAQQLPFEDDHFDCYTIAFGIRNVVDVQKALSEAYRVLKPGGRFMCLEFSQVNNSGLKWLYDKYSFNIIPAMGQVVAGDWKSYQYLVESIRKFPDQETFQEMIEDVGFRRVTYENLTFGVVAIHSGFKI